MKLLLGMLIAAAVVTPAMAAGETLTYQIVNTRGGNGPSGTFKLATADACKNAIQSMNDYWGPQGYVVVAECK
jgi:hypothetical protein